MDDSKRVKLEYIGRDSRKVRRGDVLLGYAIKCVPCRKWMAATPTGKSLTAPVFKTPNDVMKFFRNKD